MSALEVIGLVTVGAVSLIVSVWLILRACELLEGYCDQKDEPHDR